MNTYDSLDEMWLDAGATLLNEGKATDSRDGGVSHEVLGWSGRLLQPKACFLFNPIRKASPSYAAAEFLWYLRGNSCIDMMLAYAPQYVRFANENNDAYGAYGARIVQSLTFRQEYVRTKSPNLPPKGWFPEGNGGRNDGVFSPVSQLDVVMMCLAGKSESRQAVISLWEAGDLVHAQAGDQKDLPCTLSLQFFVRDKKLNLIVNMRSNDIWLGMPYDVFAWCNLQQLVANALGLELGWYQHQAGSLHNYERNVEKFTDACAPPSFNTGEMVYFADQRFMTWHRDIQDALKMEQYQRENRLITERWGRFDIHSLLGQIVLLAGSKFVGDAKRVIRRVDNKIMANYLEELCS